MFGRPVWKRLPSAARAGGACAVLGAAVFALGGAPAFAAWSAPRALGPSSGLARAALATDARGDVAVAWPLERNVGLVRTDSSVRVAVGGRSGRLAVRTVWHSSNALVGGVSVALDSRGELTVAWIDAARLRNGGTSNRHTVRAVYRTPSGRWSGVHAVGVSGPFLDAAPRLAVAGNREVLLTWLAHIPNAPSVAAAWRRPGHGFGGVGSVSASKMSLLYDPRPLFDSGGSAHVYGTGECGRNTCGVMFSTAAHSHRFGPRLIFAPGPSQDPVVSFSAPGQAIFAWESGNFESSEPFFAAPFARVMSRGALSAPVALAVGNLSPSGNPPLSVGSIAAAVAANGGGGSVGWMVARAGPPPPMAWLLVAGGDASGRFAAGSVSGNGLLPALRDGAGDVVMTEWAGLPDAYKIVYPVDLRSLAGPVPVSPVAVQPAGGSSLAPSPMPPPVSGSSLLPGRSVTVAVVQPAGRGAAVAWGTDQRLQAATWAP